MNLPICLLIPILFCGFAEGQSADESTAPAPKVEDAGNQKGKVQIAPDQQPVEDLEHSSPYCLLASVLRVRIPGW